MCVCMCARVHVCMCMGSQSVWSYVVMTGVVDTRMAGSVFVCVCVCVCVCAVCLCVYVCGE